MSTLTTEKLETLYREAKEKNSHAYPRSIAADLGVHEADVLPFTAPGLVHSINASTPDLLTRIALCGKIKMMVRNDFAVLEMFGHVKVEENDSAWFLVWETGKVKLAKSSNYRMFRIDPSDEADENAKISFQWYDSTGDALVKIFIPWAQYRNSEDTPLASINWISTNDANVFAEQSTSAYSKDAELSAARHAIENAARELRNIGLSIWLGEAGAEVTHVPAKVMDARGWFNILDPDFNLHLKEEQIESVKASGAGACRVAGAHQYLDVYTV